MFPIKRDISLKALAVATMTAALLSGCHSSAAQRAVSPLMGTWQINGPLPEPDANLPRFTQFTFHRDGTLDASYVAAGGALANVVKSSSQVRQEQDTYTLVGEHTLRIVEGSRSLSFRYEVRDGKLYMTWPNAESATVYARVHRDAESEDEGTVDGPAARATDAASDNAQQ